jgi:hypothetical protein
MAREDDRAFTQVERLTHATRAVVGDYQVAGSDGIDELGVGEKPNRLVVAGNVFRITNLRKDRGWKLAVFDQQVEATEKSIESMLGRPGQNYDRGARREGLGWALRVN